MTLDVLAAGPGATIQDLGRPRLRGLGVARSGALDRESLRIANRLVGNAEDAAGIEVTLGGLRVRAAVDTWMAVTGAEAPVTVDGVPCDRWRAVRVAAGSVLEIGLAQRGLRVYAAVAGGLVPDAVLGSRSTDTMSGLGPAPLAAGDRVRTGAASVPPPNDLAPWRVGGDEVRVGVRLGPRDDWFTADAVQRLFATAWTVSPRSDRVGLRLDGPPLARARHEELPSEGMVAGALQVPPAGAPVILLADGPVTGGYPVIAVVADADLDALAQARPGAVVRFRRA